MTQLVNADKLLFQRLIELDIKPKRDATGACPLDVALLAALESYQVSFALLLMIAKAEKDRPKSAAEIWKPQFDKSKGKGKSKGKQKGKKLVSSKFPGPFMPKGVSVKPLRKKLCAFPTTSACAMVRPTGHVQQGQACLCQMLQGAPFAGTVID